MSKRLKTIDDLRAVMAALRTPGSGCPWDLEQDFGSIAPYTIEEAYEVADAILSGDRAHLKEELGDLLLQVVYHAQMAAEEGSFTFEEVADGITMKMIRRHPHVFGDEASRLAGVAKDFWERIKAEERAGKPARSSIVADVPLGLPGMTRAVKLQEKAARVGFDWPSLGPVLAKMKEELAELEEVVARDDRDEIEAELGDLLFVIANVARHLKLDPEAALRRTNDKFTRRFRRIEEKLAVLGKTPAESTLDEMDRLWDEAKGEGL